ncbi:MAG: WecB/TagA/CpsF family glycosyltransferase [Acidobacteria bacterium]|nr:WecB/TagA/CpsF family glycosyltransferase [Acidobacteriota bacterium]
MIERRNILGVSVSALDLGTAVRQIGKWIQARDPNYVCVTPAHGVMDARLDPELLEIFNSSGMTTPDGMSIVWILRLLGNRNVSRVYGPDLMIATCEAGVERGWKHFLYGGGEGVADELAHALKRRVPGVIIAGTYTPPFRALTPEEDEEAIRAIGRSGADIVWVGISTPKQERWMAAHVGRVGAPVLIGVGAAFDFLSGRKPQAPRWIQRSGFEWLFRFANEPRRLWPRYRRYPVFALLAGRQLAHHWWRHKWGRGGVRK